MMDDELHSHNLAAWDVAEYLAINNGDTTQLVKLLREFDAYSEVNIPNLLFLADWIEGKYEKNIGRPNQNKISKGLKQRKAAETVAFFLILEKCSQESAFFKASKILHMSESAIKKSFIALKDINLVKESIFEDEILRSIK